MAKTSQTPGSWLANSFGCYTASFDRLCDRFFLKAWPSYVFIALLQGKVIWGIWQRDLTTGDTSSYFTSALRWSRSLHDNFVWSPLYTAYYGTVLKFVGGVYAATILHRVLIVFAAALCSLAIMRRLLPPALALLIACWWAILPINFETLYEIHLFAVLPVLAAWIVAASVDTAKARGAALAILLAAAVLVRNELFIASLLYGLICLGKELSDFRQGSEVRRTLRGVVACYAVPLLVAAAICIFFYWRADYKYPDLLAWARLKHSLNMCQVYAFGYSQYHPDWTSSPWLECQGLMQATFGRPQPSLLQMIEANPRAVLDQFLWNVSLIPSGLQVSLFNSMSGKVNPDYVPVNESWLALPFGIASLIVVAAGGIMVARNWRYWWSSWFKPRSGAWLILLAVASTAIPVILTQRPRPSYLFSTTLVLMAIIGSSVYVLIHKWPKIVKRLTVVAAMALLIFVPSYYLSHPSERPLYKNYLALRPFAPQLKEEGEKVVLGDYGGELANYLRLIDSDVELAESGGRSRSPITIYYYNILSTWDPTVPLDKFLEEKGINFFFVQPRMFAELRDKPQARDLLERPEILGWQRLQPVHDNDPTRFLLYRDNIKR